MNQDRNELATRILRRLMKPEHPDKIRVWACGLTHSLSQRDGLALRAQTPVRIPLTPTDMVTELNSLDPDHATITRQNLRRALRELEQDGTARSEGKIKAHVLLYFYLPKT